MSRNNPASAEAFWPIAAVERDTGLSKDTLRVWERRYGFPAPARDAIGERAYPLAQVERLRIVKRLLDGGQRPSRVVAMPLVELQRLAAALTERGCASDLPVPPDLQSYLALLHGHEIEALRRRLSQAQVRMGLGPFVRDVLVPLNTLIGEAWMRGQIEIFQEHAYSELQQNLLRQALATLPAPDAAQPRVLLTTLPGEWHSHGLLLAEAMFAIEGAQCLSLGAQTPLWNVPLAAHAYRSDIVALGFSGCMNANQVVDGLTELRREIPASVGIWVGGSSPVLLRRPVGRVKVIVNLDAIRAALQAWQSGER